MDYLIDFEALGSVLEDPEAPLPKEPAPKPQCPSAPEYWPEARTFGIIGGTPEQPWVRYLSKPLPGVPRNLPDGVSPRAVVRISANCQEGGCRHWTGDACSLAKRVIEQFDPVVVRVPPCSIRPSCLWFNQEGKAACLRCPGIATDRGMAAPDGESNVTYL
jgi:hypothetical protein